VTGGDLELAVFSGDEVRTFPLPRSGTVAIGRGTACDLRIDDPSVSRSHAVLEIGASGIAVRDLGSANGTLVRGRIGQGPEADTLNVRQLLNNRASLSVGDTILFGITSVVVRHLPAAAVSPPASQGQSSDVVVRDPVMQDVYEQATRAARSSISVLILGETGVGKEVLARAVHAASRRASAPFVGVDCATLTEPLQESELFGYDDAAFPGAPPARAGLFEAASGGTVFLDEVADLSAGAQAKLLRVVEERAITRIGSSRPRPIDVRFVAATNRDLDAAVAAGRFRQDLYFRLNGISLTIPPLRQRPDEIEPLARTFLAAACRDVERETPPTLSAEAIQALAAHRWPGNVRELRNVMQRAAVLCTGDVIRPEHLPPALLRSGPPAPPAAAGQPDGGADPRPKLAAEIDALEKARILDALEQAAGNQTRAARLLGIARGTLIARLEAFGVPRPRKPADGGGG
jgi:two-component system response regulator AtoC